MMPISPGWIEAIKLTDMVGRKRGGSIFDFTTNKTWDSGQAICREAYGPDWMNNPEFKEANDAEIAPQSYLDAAKRILENMPDWAIEKEE
jgi:hypothetical protein